MCKSTSAITLNSHYCDNKFLQPTTETARCKILRQFYLTSIFKNLNSYSKVVVGAGFSYDIAVFNAL